MTLEKKLEIKECKPLEGGIRFLEHLGARLEKRRGVRSIEKSIIENSPLWATMYLSSHFSTEFSSGKVVLVEEKDGMVILFGIHSTDYSPYRSSEMARLLAPNAAEIGAVNFTPNWETGEIFLERSMSQSVRPLETQYYQVVKERLEEALAEFISQIKSAEKERPPKGLF